MSDHEQHRSAIREQLQRDMAQNKTFSFFEKVNALTYHFAMVIFGEWLCKEKYERYLATFEEFVKLDDERKKNA